jgi:hypothetical protein
MSPFDINSVVFHFDDFNYGKRSQPYFFLTIATQLFCFHKLLYYFKYMFYRCAGKALIWKVMDNRRRTLNDIISTIFLLNVGTVPTAWYIFFHFVIVLFKLSSSQINLYCVSAEISKHQRYRSILHV